MFQKNVSLQPFNSFGVECHSKYFQTITSTYQLLQIVASDLRKEEKHWILGGGYNTLFTTDFFDGMVLKMEMKGIKILSEDDHTVLVQVAAGESRNDFIQWAIEHQLGGIENLINIPGSVGSSAVSNIGAYGQEVSNVITEVMGLNLESQTIQKLSPEDCQFAYRESVFKHALQDRFIITHITFQLKKIDDFYLFNTDYQDIKNYFVDRAIDFEKMNYQDKLQALTQAIVMIRSAKLPDPKQIGTAGSYFKNPKIGIPQREPLHQKFPNLVSRIEEDEQIKLSAGQLIELAGWKGKSLRLVAVSPKHALVILNTGTRGSDIAELAQQIQESVFEKFGIQLEPEVRYCQ